MADLALDKLAVQALTALESAVVCDSNALTLSRTLLFTVTFRPAVGTERCGDAEGNSGETMTGFSRARFVVSGVSEGVSDTLERRTFARSTPSRAGDVSVSCWPSLLPLAAAVEVR